MSSAHTGCPMTAAAQTARGITERRFVVSADVEGVNEFRGAGRVWGESGRLRAAGHARLCALVRSWPGVVRPAEGVRPVSRRKTR